MHAETIQARVVDHCVDAKTGSGETSGEMARAARQVIGG